jgi:hypothetical protein
MLFRCVQELLVPVQSAPTPDEFLTAGENARTIPPMRSMPSSPPEHVLTDVPGNGKNVARTNLLPNACLAVKTHII